MPSVTVTLLGGFAADVDGAPVPATAWRLKKARELVKLLALAPGHRLHREQVMDELWRDRPPAAAVNNLHQAVHAARRALAPEAIEVRDEMLRLAADVDVDALEDAAARARADPTAPAYRAALTLYRGELLPENRFDDWALERRDELAELADELARELDELGPGEVAPAPSLPADASSFVGRDRELAELHALLRGTRLLTLAGTGGAGKTRLALELGRAAEPRYAGGAALVGLASLSDGRLATDAIAAALDVRALPGQPLLDAVVAFLAPRRLLLIVDNCEHLLAAAATVADTLLRAAPQLTILATSREPLRVAGEVVFRVPSLDIPDPERVVEPDELLGYEAVQLFVERAGAAAPGFALDRDNATDVARICLRLDGLPLALELAAGRLAALGPGAIADRLDDRFRLLRGAGHAAPTRQQTLSATLQWSHDLLEPDERILFRRLACFAGGFELDAVEQVCADDDLDPAAIADVLARLAEKSLVVADDDASRERRLRLLETVRLYALERLDESGERAALAERHARWALELAQAQRGAPRLDRDAANLRLALDTLLDRAPDDALRCCASLLAFWLRRIDLGEGRRRLQQALAAAPEPTALRADALLAAAAIEFRSGVLSDTAAYAEESLVVATQLEDAQAQWRALQFLGEIGIAIDDAEGAAARFEEALDLARRERFAPGEAVCTYSLGVSAWIRGDLDDADRLVAAGLELFRALEGWPGTIASPVNIAEVRTGGADGQAAMRIIFEDTLQPFAELNGDAAVSYVLANFATFARSRGDLGRARALLDESSARLAAGGDEQGQAAVLVRRAYLELAGDTLPAARAALEEALVMRRAQADRRGQGLVLAGLGLIETRAQAFESADRHLEAARDIFRRAGDRWGLASTLWRTADLALARGRLDDARDALLEARAVLGATQRERWIATTLSGLAEVALLRGDDAEAAVLLGDARERYAARGDDAGVAGVQARLDALAKDVQSERKAAPDTTPRNDKAKGSPQ